MDTFFQFVSIFALFFGIAGLVYATEVSKRCQLMIAERMNEVETDVLKKVEKQDIFIDKSVRRLRNTLSNLEQIEQAQTREINSLRKSLEPVVRKVESYPVRETKGEEQEWKATGSGSSVTPIF